MNMLEASGLPLCVQEFRLQMFEFNLKVNVKSKALQAIGMLMNLNFNHSNLGDSFHDVGIISSSKENVAHRLIKQTGKLIQELV